MSNPHPPASFVKGDPRINRKGRKPKEQSITNALEVYLQGELEPGQTRLDRLVTKLYEIAEKGDTNALKYIIDRIDGKTPETINAIQFNTFADWRKQLIEVDEEKEKE